MTVYMSIDKQFKIVTIKVWGEARYFVYERWHNYSGNRGHMTLGSAVKKVNKLMAERM